MIPKHYARKAFGSKFRSYRIFFYVSAACFIFGLLAETFLFGSGDLAAGGAAGGLALFSVLFPLEALWALLLFLSGVTLYAPALSFVSAALRGALTGFCLSLLFPLGKKSILLFLLLGLYLLLSAWLTLAYGTFCATVAMRIYGQKRSTPLFGGTLFYSSLVCGRVNLRFLFSYVLLFLAVLCFSAALCAAYAFLRLWV